MIPFNTPVKILAVAISLITCCLFFSCKKTDTINTVTEQPADFSKKVIASVNGFVSNEYNSPVTGANVQYGESFSTTDQYGYFEIKNATVTENAGVVTVKMSGYFNGVKTFISEAGKKNFCRIKLIPKTSSGNVDAASGGDVTLSNGLKVSLPAAGIVDAATKAAYSGTVNVSSSWINPVADDIDEIMPGDLRGINTNGYLRSLTSFGMAAVELTGNSGQLLQIADGKKATLTFPLPNTVAADAPATIPLWYFDEAKGLWIEEGTATKTGNTYVGDVKHFTFWNCDLPNATASVSFTIKDSTNNPLSNVSYEIVPLATNWWSHSSGCTDETGYIKCPVTANTQYKIQFLSNGCIIPFSKTFTVENKNVELGDVKLPGGFVATITGTVTNCNNLPLSNGKIMMKNGNSFESFFLYNGNFIYSTLVCNNTNQIPFFAEDPSSSQQSQPVTKMINAGTNNIGNIHACGVSTEEYSNISINGQQYILGPFGGVILSGFQTVQNAPFHKTSFNISLSKLTNGTYVSYNDQVSWEFMHPQNTPVIGGQQFIEGLMITPGPSNPENTQLMLWPYSKLTNAGPGSVPVTITEYDVIGGYISGYFNGNLYTTMNGDTTNPYHIIYSFRIKN